MVEIHFLISMVRDEFVKVEPEEYNSVEEQNKEFVYHTMQYEKAKKSGDSKILLALASLVLCMTFSFMMETNLQS